jgi:hypothetical protein
MAIVKFPGSLPAPYQLELPRAQLCGILQELTAGLMECQLDLIKAESAPDFAAAVRKTAEKVSEANASWSAMSNTIRDSWHI